MSEEKGKSDELVAAPTPPLKLPAWCTTVLRLLPVSAQNALVSVLLRLRRLPIAEFYAYMWDTNKPLLASTLFVNYLLPVLLEALPWYLSRRKLSKRLRDDRNTLQHRMIKGEPFSAGGMTSFVLMSILFAVMQTFDQILRNRVDLANQLLVKRMVMERILYSEIGALQSKYSEVFGEEVRSDQLDARVFGDISQTLHLFNTVIPTVFRSTFTFATSAYELYGQRDRIDSLAIVRPTVVGLVGELLDYARTKLVSEAQVLQLQRNESAMSRVVTNMLDGLAEVQVNNMQEHQLRALDAVVAEQVATKQGWATLAERVYRVTSNRAVFDFATEIYTVQWVMQRRGIDHETYRKVQNDIDYVTRLFRRIYQQCKSGWEILDTQTRVIALLNLPNFLSERPHNRERHLRQQRLLEAPATTAESEAKPEAETKSAEPQSKRSVADSAELESKAAASSSPPARLDFRELVVKRVRFAYKPELPPALDIRTKGATLSASPSASSPAAAAPAAAALTSPLSSRSEAARGSLPLLLRSRTADTAAAGAGPGFGLGLGSGLQAGAGQAALDESALSCEFKLERGKTYAVVGQNRSGKSTLLQLICKLYQADAGSEILLNDRPFEAIPRTELRDVISYVAQRPFIFPATIEENIRMGSTQSAEEVEAAAEAAGVFVFDRPRVFASAGAAGDLPPGTSLLAHRSVQRLKPWEQNYLKEWALRAGSWLGKVWGSLSGDDAGDDASATLEAIPFPQASRESALLVSKHHAEFPVPALPPREASTEEAKQDSVDAGVTATATAAESKASRADESDSAPIAAPQPRRRVAGLSDAEWEAFQQRQTQRQQSQQQQSQGGVPDGQGTQPRSWSAFAEPVAPLIERKTESPAADAAGAGMLAASAATSAASASSPGSSSKGSESARPLHPVLAMETEARGANLSGGFAQSVALARIFLRKDAQIVILDEALGQMDAIKKREFIFPRLFAFVRQHNMTLVLVTHEVAQVCPLVDHVYVMEKGRVVNSGSHELLVATNAQPYGRLCAM